MSKFYGTVIGAASTDATRRGHRDIKVSAQSWDGSVITRLWYNTNGELMVDLEHSDCSSTYGRTLFSGTMDEFLKVFKTVA